MDDSREKAGGMLDPVGAYDFTGQVAIITGSGSPTGIGYATAEILGGLGCAVVLGGTTDRVQERADRLRRNGVDAIGVVGDLTRPEDCITLVRAALQRGARIDVLVNNAGMISTARPISESGTIEQMSEPTWHQGLQRNLDPAFLVTQATVPTMLAQAYGRIVMVSSVTGPVMAMTADIAYATAKAGLVGLTRALAVDLASSGITVNAVAPGWIATGSQTQQEHAQGLHTPLGRSGTPAEVAAAIIALSAPGASYITGQCLVVDGGNSIAEQRGP
jgi:3-oxoacyl-[acyl-carrier protein] reductase